MEIKSEPQIAAELDLAIPEVHAMTPTWREGIVKKKEPVTLKGEVECDEVYVVAGHKGQPDMVRELGRPGRRRRLKGKRGRGPLDTEKPPVFGMIQRDGAVVIQMLPNVQQTTIQPIMTTTMETVTLIDTEE